MSAVSKISIYCFVGDSAVIESGRTSQSEREEMSRLSDSRTSLTLVERLRQYPWNAEAWDRFVELYRPKIYGWCRAWGLQEADADDVAQDVIARLTQKMADFKYDQTRCFRTG